MHLQISFILLLLPLTFAENTFAGSFDGNPLRSRSLASIPKRDLEKIYLDLLQVRDAYEATKARRDAFTEELIARYDFGLPKEDQLLGRDMEDIFDIFQTREVVETKLPPGCCLKQSPEGCKIVDLSKPGCGNTFNSNDPNFVVIPPKAPAKGS